MKMKKNIIKKTLHSKKYIISYKKCYKLFKKRKYLKNKYIKINLFFIKYYKKINFLLSYHYNNIKIINKNINIFSYNYLNSITDGLILKYDKLIVQNLNNNNIIFTNIKKNKKILSKKIIDITNLHLFSYTIDLFYIDDFNINTNFFFLDYIYIFIINLFFFLKEIYILNILLIFKNIKI